MKRYRNTKKINKKDDIEIEDRKSFANQNIVIIIIFVIGLGLIFFGAYCRTEKMYSEYVTFAISCIGISILTAGFISFMNNVFIKKEFLKQMENTTLSVIESKMPQRYRNLREAGILDAFMRLSSSSMVQKLRKAKNCEIYVMKMWISNIDELDKIIIDAVQKRGCTVRILLLSPDSDEAIEKRASSLINRDDEYIKVAIKQNILTINNIVNQLSTEELKRFQFRVHNSFVAISLIGISDEITMGLYLRNKLSTQGLQIRFIGPTKSHYQEIRDHFEVEWENANEYNMQIVEKK